MKKITDDERLKEYLMYTYDDKDIVIADGLSKAFIGVATLVNVGEVCVYDGAKVIKILMKRDKMSHDEAAEFFAYNIAGAYVGARTPIFVNTHDARDAFPKPLHGIQP